MANNKGRSSLKFSLYNNGLYGFRIKMPTNQRKLGFRRWLKTGAKVDLYPKKQGFSVTCRGKGRIKISSTGMIKSNLAREAPKGWYKAKLYKEQIHFEYVGLSDYAIKTYGF